jgi:hypothetical protein
MTDLWGVGPFMAKEVLLDYILATGWRPSDWETWTPVGPGARRGASYILRGDPELKVSETATLALVREVYAQRGERWSSAFPELDLTDIQFQFCELAKYMKAKLGVGRPKKTFDRPTIDDVTRAIYVLKSPTPGQMPELLRAIAVVEASTERPLIVDAEDQT